MSNQKHEICRPENRPVSDKFHVPKFQNMPPGTKYTTLSNGWIVAVVHITPELALEFLERLPDNQRPQKDNAVRRYESSMSEEKWILTHQGLAFDEQGHLVDGRNRCAACVASNKSFLTLVFFGVGKDSFSEAMQVSDGHATRSLRDSAKVAGMDVKANAISAITTMIRYGLHGGQTMMSLASKLRKLEIMRVFQANAEMVTGWCSGGELAKAVAVSPATGAILAATFHTSLATLERFCTILVDKDQPVAGEMAARTLRNWLIVNRGMNDDHRKEAFLKTCRAIQLFTQGKDTDRIHPAPVNPFKINHLIPKMSGQDQDVDEEDIEGTL